MRIRHSPEQQINQSGNKDDIRHIYDGDSNFEESVEALGYQHESRNRFEKKSQVSHEDNKKGPMEG